MTDKNKQYMLRQIGLLIAYYRKTRGLSQVELAEAINASRTHISNIEASNMKTRISLDTLFSISEALDVPVKCFFEFPDTKN